MNAGNKQPNSQHCRLELGAGIGDNCWFQFPAYLVTDYIASASIITHRHGGVLPNAPKQW